MPRQACSLSPQKTAKILTFPWPFLEISLTFHSHSILPQLRVDRSISILVQSIGDLMLMGHEVEYHHLQYNLSPSLSLQFQSFLPDWPNAWCDGNDNTRAVFESAIALKSSWVSFLLMHSQLSEPYCIVPIIPHRCFAPKKQGPPTSLSFSYHGIVIVLSSVLRFTDSADLAQGVAQPKDGGNSCSELQGKAEVDVSTCQGWENYRWLQKRSKRAPFPIVQNGRKKKDADEDYVDEIDFGMLFCRLIDADGRFWEETLWNFACHHGCFLQFHMARLDFGTVGVVSAKWLALLLLLTYCFCSHTVSSQLPQAATCARALCPFAKPHGGATLANHSLRRDGQVFFVGKVACRLSWNLNCPKSESVLDLENRCSFHICSEHGGIPPRGTGTLKDSQIVA